VFDPVGDDSLRKLDMSLARMALRFPLSVEVYEWKSFIDRPAEVNPTVIGKSFLMKSNGKQLEQMMKSMEDAVVQSMVDSVVQLELHL